MVSASRPSIRLPSLRLHKASGQAVVTVRGRDIYCGKFGSPEATAHYQPVIADLLASGPEVIRHHGAPRPGARRPAFTPPTARTVSVAELLLAYVEHAEREYPPFLVMSKGQNPNIPDGSRTGEKVIRSPTDCEES